MISKSRRSVLLTAATGALLMTMGAVATPAAATVRYYPIAPDTRVNVRSGPGTGYSIVRVLPVGASVPIFCQRPGTTVSGYYGTSDIWDNIDSGEYISDTYVNTGSDGYVAPRCS